MYLALDLARVSGVAWGDPFDLHARPSFESWTLGEPNSPLGARGLDLMQRLERHLYNFPPAKVFIEKPMRVTGMLKKGGADQSTIMQLNGLVFIALTICWSRRIPTALHERQDVLKHFTGQPRYKDGKDGKRACQTRIKQIWGLIVGEDAADAGALLHYGAALEDQFAFLEARANEPVMRR